VGSNLHEITIFALACHDLPDDQDDHEKTRFANGTPSVFHYGLGSIRNTPRAKLLISPVYGPAWVLSDRLKPCLSNVRIQIRLPPAGHNIPSLDFTSDEEGNASTILAADVRGNLVSCQTSPESSRHIRTLPVY
jgi:hypothetical protein